MDSKYYDDKYKQGLYWGMKPGNSTIKLLKYAKSGKVLDLGSGEGRDDIFMAKNGFDVTGVDISETGVKRMLETAKEMGVKVKGLVQDISKFEFKEKYDIIISNNTLQFLSEKDAKRVISEMKENTNEGGLNVIVSFTEDNPSKELPYLFKKGELKSMYSYWEILEYEEFMMEPEKHGRDGKLHQHAVVTLIARKL
jgi:tellurite methyltransferase